MKNVVVRDLIKVLQQVPADAPVVIQYNAGTRRSDDISVVTEGDTVILDADGWLDDYV